MPAGYAATTEMESVLQLTTLTAELSDLRVIEEPVGTSRPPSNILVEGNPFVVHSEIHFVGIQAPSPWPEVAVDVQYFLEKFGPDPGHLTAIQTNTYIGPMLTSGGRSTFPLTVKGNAFTPPLTAGVYKLAASVQVRWANGSVVIMSGFIEGAPLSVVKP